MLFRPFVYGELLLLSWYYRLLSRQLQLQKRLATATSFMCRRLVILLSQFSNKVTIWKVYLSDKFELIFYWWQPDTRFGVRKLLILPLLLELYYCSTAINKNIKHILRKAWIELHMYNNIAWRRNEDPRKCWGKRGISKFSLSFSSFLVFFKYFVCHVFPCKTLIGTLSNEDGDADDDGKEQ